MPKSPASAELTLETKNVLKDLSKVQFDCPTIYYPPWPKVLETYGNITLIDTPEKTNNLFQILDFTPNQMQHLRKCIINVRSQNRFSSNVMHKFTFGKKLSRD